MITGQITVHLYDDGEVQARPWKIQQEIEQ